MTASTWRPYREPFLVTLRRNGIIALVAGTILSRWLGGLAHLPAAVLLAIWPSFGGHYIEVWFLNWLRPQLPATRSVQIAARLAVWFIGGVVLAYGMKLTAIRLVGRRLAHWPAWWVCGFALIGIELVVHLVARLRGRPGSYNGGR